MRGFRAAALGCLGASFQRRLTMRDSVSRPTSLALLLLVLFISSLPSVTYVQLYIYPDKVTPVILVEVFHSDIPLHENLKAI